MGNEAKTENLVREVLRQKGYYSDTDIIIEEKKSDNPKINKLLKNASKKGNKQGYPEFIIGSKLHSDLVIVIECKADTSKHASEKLDCYADYAVDGALLYASFLAKEFDVVAIAVSGEDINNSNISHYLYLKDDVKYSQVFGSEILSFDNYYNSYIKMPQKFNQDLEVLVNYSLELNKLLHTKKVKESQRSLLISGILIALQNQAFRQGYKGHRTAQHLVDNLVKTIVDELSTAHLNGKNIANLNYAFSFIKTHPLLSTDKQLVENMISEMDNRINSFIKTHKYYDAIGRFYVEFLRYANSDKGLGIVLTPPHITSLFSELANVNQNSVVVDNCCGTTGFLISAMKEMIDDAKDNEDKIKNIKSCQLAGIEIMDDIYALAISNMILHGDGKANIYQRDCFDRDSIALIKNKYRPTIGLLNPPYKVKKEDREELEYILNNLEMLEPNGRCITIVPMSCALASGGKPFEFKKQLLEKHTLEAVMSMPNELFYDSNIGVVTCVLILTAHRPHPNNKETYFGYYKDDGFAKRKPKGRIDAFGKWGNIKAKWVTSYMNRRVEAGFSVNKTVTANDEWCAEAYMETDYSDLSDGVFRENILNYTSFRVKVGDLSFINNFPKDSKQIKLSNRDWKFFKYEDLFDIKIGKSIDLNKLEQVENGMNYVGRTEENNGITARVLNDGSFTVYEANCITVPMVGNELKSSYQVEPFCVSQNIAILRPRNFSLNPYIASFLNTIIRKDVFRFTYGRTLSLERLRMLKIKLPVDSKGKADWEFMENYIKSLPYSSNL
jgi:type I restriction-modification system DNA methylase subunit